MFFLSRVFFLCTIIGLGTGCVSQVWTGASLIYDRHHLYKKITDYQLSSQASRLLLRDNLFKMSGNLLDVTAFNRDVLISGHVKTQLLKQMLDSRLAYMKDYRHLYNEVSIEHMEPQQVTDTWITTKIRTGIFSDASIDPNDFKVVTTDGIVYLMGEARPDQAKRVIQLARTTEGVRRVVTLLIQ